MCHIAMWFDATPVSHSLLIYYPGDQNHSEAKILGEAGVYILALFLQLEII